jgi:hypothetical protein
MFFINFKARILIFEIFRNVKFRTAQFLDNVFLFFISRALLIQPMGNRQGCGEIFLDQLMYNDDICDRRRFKLSLNFHDQFQKNTESRPFQILLSM